MQTCNIDPCLSVYIGIEGHIRIYIVTLHKLCYVVAHLLFLYSLRMKECWLARIIATCSFPNLSILHIEIKDSFYLYKLVSTYMYMYIITYLFLLSIFYELSRVLTCKMSNNFPDLNHAFEIEDVYLDLYMCYFVTHLFLLSYRQAKCWLAGLVIIFLTWPGPFSVLRMRTVFSCANWYLHGYICCFVLSL